MPWQPLPVLFPDVEQVLSSELRARLVAAGEAGVFTSRAIPSQRRPRMVIVNRDGGNSDGLTDRPMLRVRVWDETPQAANGLARTVEALFYGLPGSVGVVRVQKQSGPYEVPDESGGHQRYLLFELHIQPEGVLS